MIAIRKFPEGHTLLFSFRPLCLRRREIRRRSRLRRAVGRKSSSQRSKRIGAEDVRRFVASKKPTRIEKKAYFPPLSTACHRRCPLFLRFFFDGSTPASENDIPSRTFVRKILREREGISNRVHEGE